MKTNTLLKKLYELKETDPYSKDVTFNFIKYNELIEKIKDDLIKENLPEGSSKKQYTAIKKFLFNKENRREVLRLTHIDEKDRQVFTDSYLLFRFYNEAIIDGLPKTSDPENKDITYPQTDRLCDPIFESNFKSPGYKISDLKNIIRTADQSVDIELTEDGTIKARFGKKKLQQFIDIMNFKNNDLISFLYPAVTRPGFIIRPLGVKYNNREGIILPMRTE